MDTVLQILGAIAAVVGIVIIYPFLMFWCAYLGGWIASLVIGNQLAFALNTLFNVTFFQASMIKWCAAALGWIGGYFKATTSIKSK